MGEPVLGVVIKAVVCHTRLALPEDRREDAERVHELHTRGCRIARSLQGGIEVQTELELLSACASSEVMELPST